jgi:hypothetical protein
MKETMNEDRLVIFCLSENDAERLAAQLRFLAVIDDREPWGRLAADLETNIKQQQAHFYQCPACHN